MNPRHPLALCLILHLFACTTQGERVYPDGEPNPYLTESEGYGLVALVHQVGRTDIDVSGQFMQFRGYSKEAAIATVALPGLSTVVNTPDHGSGCIWVDLSPTGARADGGSSIDLLDLGTLRVTPPIGRPYTLNPRDYPHLSFSVSGQVYDTTETTTLDFEPVGAYEVALAGFDGRGIRGTLAPPEVARIETLNWETDGLGIRWSDSKSVLVIIQAAIGAKQSAVVCRPEGGTVVVPSVLVHSLEAPKVRVSVLRTSGATATSTEFAETEFLFIVKDEVEFSLPTRQDVPQREDSNSIGDGSP